MIDDSENLHSTANRLCAIVNISILKSYARCVCSMAPNNIRIVKGLKKSKLPVGPLAVICKGKLFICGMNCLWQ